MLLGVLASGGCSTSATDVDPVLSMAPTSMQDPVLPDRVSVLPSTGGILPLALDDAQGPEAIGLKLGEAGTAPAVEASDAAVQTASLSKAEPVALASVAAAQTTSKGEAELPRATQVAAYAGPTPSATSLAVAMTPPAAPTVADGPGKLDFLIAHYARAYEVPEALVRRVVKRESNFRPEARNGPYWGLMQIRHDTARGMGYDGPPSGLLDAETNLRFAVRYLRGAYMVAKGDHDRSVLFYARGYYYDAKRAGLLDETGLGRDRTRRKPG